MMAVFFLFFFWGREASRARRRARAGRNGSRPVGTHDQQRIEGGTCEVRPRQTGESRQVNGSSCSVTTNRHRQISPTGITNREQQDRPKVRDSIAERADGNETAEDRPPIPRIVAIPWPEGESMVGRARLPPPGPGFATKWIEDPKSPWRAHSSRSGIDAAAADRGHVKPRLT